MFAQDIDALYGSHEKENSQEGLSILPQLSFDFLNSQNLIIQEQPIQKIQASRQSFEPKKNEDDQDYLCFSFLQKDFNFQREEYLSFNQEIDELFQYNSNHFDHQQINDENHHFQDNNLMDLNKYYHEKKIIPNYQQENVLSSQIQKTQKNHNYYCNQNINQQNVIYQQNYNNNKKEIDVQLENQQSPHKYMKLDIHEIFQSDTFTFSEQLFNESYFSCNTNPNKSNYKKMEILNIQKQNNDLQNVQNQQQINYFFNAEDNNQQEHGKYISNKTDIQQTKKYSSQQQTNRRQQNCVVSNKIKKMKIRHKNVMGEDSCQETKNFANYIFKFLIEQIQLFYPENKIFEKSKKMSIKSFNNYLVQQLALLSNKDKQLFIQKMLFIIKTSFIQKATKYDNYKTQYKILKYKIGMEVIIQNPGKFKSLKQANQFGRKQIK